MFFILSAALFVPSCEKPERYVKLEALEIPDADISYTYAILKGEIIDIGSIPITDYGIVISESGSPVLGISQGLHLGPLTSKGVFQDTIKNLKKNTLYYFRVFVIVNAEEKYSQKTPKFRTKDTKEPAITAGTIADLTITSASLAGEVTSDGGEPETVRGLCWGASPSPTLTSCIDTTVNGTGMGSFTGAITGLNPGTSYYVRAYATNSKGTGYNSTDIVFKTHNLPKVTTTAITSITNTGATSGGSVTDDGDVEVTTRGICWGTASLPVIELTTKTIDGSGKGTFVSTITGLTPLTTYFVRAYATNKYGASYGEEISFTATKPPTVITKAATLIGNTTATLNANINAHSFATTVTFEYGLTTEYGSSITSSASPVSGTTATDILANLTLLSPGTSYHFRVKAESAGGTVFGEDLAFTTLQPPSATTGAATNVTTTSATLNGTVNANNSSTSVSFEYGPTIDYGSSIAATPSPVEGNTLTIVTASLTGLSEGTVYHYRIRAISDGGTVYGDDVIITSLASPVATTTAATAITGTTAILNATVNAKDLSTTVEFEYGTSPSYGTTITVTQSPVSGNLDTPVSIGISSLNSGTTYHFRVKATSSAGTSFGGDLTFTTLLPPSATTSAATLPGNTTVTLNGTVNANNSSTTVTFEYGTTTDYGTTVTAIQSPVSGNTVTSVSAELTGLTPGSTYHFKVKAVSEGGNGNGSDLTFTTTQPPTVTTGIPESVSTTSATLNGTVNANNFSSTVTFEYGLTTDYGFTATATQSPVTGNGATSVSVNLTGLTPSTNYHFRLIAVSSAGITKGSDDSFTTSAVPLTVTDFEGNVYNTVQIGSQTWMKENLKSTKYSDGSNMSVAWAYGDNESLANIYGRLYRWYEATDIKNACPTNWHVPNYSEWTTLESYLGGSAIAGGKMKESGLSHWNSPNTGATNESGFTALPGGDKYPGTGVYGVLGIHSYLWSRDFYVSVIKNDESTLSIVDAMYADYGFSIRCIKGEIPLTETVAASAVASTTTTLNGKVNPNGASTTVSFEYGETTSYGSSATAIQSPVTGPIPVIVSADLTGLTPGITYHFRVKAVNTGGTSYGNDMTFTTPAVPVGTVLDSDGNIYNTVVIGTQTWMAENLKTTRFNDFTTIPNVTDRYTFGQAIWSPAYCWYNNDAVSYKNTYGAFYNFHAVDAGGLCPTGWHVPTQSEWTDLVNYLGGYSVAGGKLKESGLDHWVSPNTDATNESGFTALPGGQLPYNGDFNSIGYSSGWWTCTFSPTMGSTYATSWSLSYNTSVIGNAYQYLNTGNYVRCIQGELPSIITVTATDISSTSVTLNGMVNPKGIPTTVTFEYGTIAPPNYQASIEVLQNPVSGDNPVNVSVSLSGLITGTKYYYRLVTNNYRGTNRSTGFSFTTPFVDFDGNVYNVIQGRDYQWMKENLKVTHYANGDPIDNIIDNSQWGASTSGTYCWYDNNISYKDNYGALYNYYAIKDNRQICPVGWRVSTDADLSWSLIEPTGSTPIAGGKMKESGLTHWNSPNTGADNSSGFTGLPGGQRQTDGTFVNIGMYGFWWSPKYDDINQSYGYKLFYNDSGINLQIYEKQSGFSVRCIK